MSLVSSVGRDGGYAAPRRRRGSHDDIPLASHLPVDAAAALRRHRRVARWLGFPSTERPSRLLQLSLPAGGLSLLGSFGVVLVAARRTRRRRRPRHSAGARQPRSSAAARRLRRRLPSMRFFFTMLLISQFASTTRW